MSAKVRNVCHSTQNMVIIFMLRGIVIIKIFACKNSLLRKILFVIRLSEAILSPPKKRMIYIFSFGKKIAGFLLNISL